jgi:hypothetical protein
MHRAATEARRYQIEKSAGEDAGAFEALAPLSEQFGPEGVRDAEVVGVLRARVSMRASHSRSMAHVLRAVGLRRLALGRRLGRGLLRLARLVRARGVLQKPV